MKLWRISDYNDLLGLGGLYAAGRWHTKGRRIVYTSEHPALALLEVLAHLHRTEPPTRYQLLTIELPDGLAIEAPGGDLAQDATRTFGDRWLASASSLTLRVPSVVAPHSYNYLLNRSHTGIAGVRILAAERWPFGARLIA